MKKLKGIILVAIFSLASLMMPFDIFADNNITTNYGSGTTDWSSKLTVTNYCEGTNAQASCKLTFTANDDYYGVIYFDAYINSTLTYSNAMVYMAGGIGEYNYLFYQSGVKPIDRVDIYLVNLHLPSSNVDLFDVIQLLTAINSSNSAIYNNTVTIKNNLISILNEVIESNGYLETISNYRQYNFPIESYSFITMLKNYEFVDFKENYSYSYPIIKLPSGVVIRSMWGTTDANYRQVLILGVNKNINNLTTFRNFFTDNNANIESVEAIYRNDHLNLQSFIKVTYTIGSNGNNATFTTKTELEVIPIYINYTRVKTLTTDFCLTWGLSNQLLDDLHIIANGTTQSQSSVSDVTQKNNQFSSDSQQLIGLEDSYNNDMNNKLNAIDTTTGLNGFGGYFMNSSVWVRTQFDRLTNNTPYGSMIVYGMTLGLALLLLGKVFL